MGRSEKALDLEEKQRNIAKHHTYTAEQEQLNKAEELDWTHSKRQLSTEGDNGRKDGREERKRKA